MYRDTKDTIAFWIYAALGICACLFILALTYVAIVNA